MAVSNSFCCRDVNKSVNERLINQSRLKNDGFRVITNKKHALNSFMMEADII